MGIPTITKKIMLEEFSLFVSYIARLVKVLYNFSLSLTFWDGILFVGLICLVIYRFRRMKKYAISSVSINLPFSLGNITYDLREDDRVVAWKLYTQLKTRKAALIFDENHDVIVDVYDSLYELFPISRELLMNITPHIIEKQPNIADIVLRVQNDGLRPHLTKWQSVFRRWWEVELGKPTNQNLKLQTIQKQFPEYKELIEDLKKMNVELNKYAEELLIIAKSEKKVHKAKKLIPIEPSEQSKTLGTNIAGINS